jgi:HTH-type transcriptional regulator, sugar sensing transcriptional regulator
MSTFTDSMPIISSLIKFFCCKTIIKTVNIVSKLFDNVDDMTLEDGLVAVGLDEKERRFYLAALDAGRAPVAAVARQAGVSRTLGYDLLEKLHARGLLNQVEGQEGRLVVAEDPRALINEWQRRRDILDEVVPELRGIFAGSASKPRVRIYEGLEGIRRALLETLDCSSKLLFGILSMRELVEAPGKIWMDEFITQRVARGIHLQVIRSEGRDVEAAWTSSETELRELRFSPPDIDLNMTMYISDHKVVYVSSSAENYAIIIDSVEFASFKKSIFSLVWRVSRSF